MSKALPGAGGYLSAQSAARGLGPSTSTSLIAGDRRKIHTSFTERGSEMIEEYDLATDQLLLRKLRHKSALGSWAPWIYEVGEPVAKFNADRDLLLESPSLNPLFVRQDIPTHFQFRIRNLPYPLDNYSVSIEDATQEIVLRTLNKKYYKRMSIPDLKAAGPVAGKLDPKSLSFTHANNTLIISYIKPPQILEMEARNKMDIKRMGNGATSAVAGSAAPAKPLTAAQKLLADAQASGSSGGAASSGSSSSAGGPAGGPGEFAGLNGLKGLGKDGDCKQQ